MDGISLIIPIYNVEEYIEECLESVILSMKEFTNIQVILVDDGSNDRSGKIAQTYMNRDKNILFVPKENGGVSDARNFGMQFCIYDYICFLDSDDTISENYFDVLLNQIKYKPDLIIFDTKIINGKENNKTLEGIEYKDILWTIHTSSWNKVYRRKLFNEVAFPKGKIFEDVGTVYKLLFFVGDVIYINEHLYNYRTSRKGSILDTISPKINDIYEMLDNTYQFYKEKNALTEENLEGLCYQYIKLLMWSNMYRQLKFFKFNFFAFYKKMKKTRDAINLLFKDWKVNKLLIRNKAFFEERYGRNYIKRIDNIGKNFILTFFTVMKLVIRNLSRT